MGVSAFVTSETAADVSCILDYHRCYRLRVRNIIYSAIVFASLTTKHSLTKGLRIPYVEMSEYFSCELHYETDLKPTISRKTWPILLIVRSLPSPMNVITHTVHCVGASQSHCGRFVPLTSIVEILSPRLTSRNLGLGIGAYKFNHFLGH